jgi:Rac GTPase-activating protein 1
MGTISEYVPYTVPMVPSLIVHCVNEVDLHDLNDIEVCRISDAEKDGMELKVQNISMAQTF